MERVNMETYITICKIDSQQEFAVWLRKLKQGLCYQPRGVGWGGRWEVTYVYLLRFLANFNILLRFDRKQQSSIKQLSFNKK